MTTTPAPTDHDTLKTLLDAMPEGPWRVAQSQPNPGIRTAAGWEVVWATYADTGPKVLEFIAAARNALPALLDELAKTGAELDEAHAVLRGADTWIERVGMTTEAVIIMAEDKTPGLTLLADLALWNDRRRELLAEANPATTAEPADEHCCGCDTAYDMHCTCACHDVKPASPEVRAEVLTAIGVVPVVTDTSLPADTLMVVSPDGRVDGSVKVINIGLLPEPADEPKATHGFTAHGHHCCELAPVGERPNRVSRCGGTRMCRDCKDAANRIHGAGPAAG